MANVPVTRRIHPSAVGYLSFRLRGSRRSQYIWILPCQVLQEAQLDICLEPHITSIFALSTKAVKLVSMQLTAVLFTVTALSTAAFAKPAGGNKPTGGPAAAQVTIYPGGATPYTCASADTVRDQSIGPTARRSGYLHLTASTKRR